MKKMLRPLMFNLFIISMLFGCTKSSDPSSSAGGCSFTFKGKTFTSTVVSCGLGSLSSNGGSGTSAWVMSIDIGNKYVGLQITDGPYENENAIFTKSGNSVSFNIPVENIDSDRATISGKCTCSVGSL